MFGHDWGTFSYSLAGSWLIEQKYFNNIANPADFTEIASTAVLPARSPDLAADLAARSTA